MFHPVVLDKDPVLDGKRAYPFQSSDGKGFVFCEHTPGICKYCKLFTGHHSLELEEYALRSNSCIEGGPQERSEFPAPVEFALVQLFFEVFLVTTKREFLEVTLNSLCRMMVSKRMDPRVSSCFLLYLDFIMEKESQASTLLLAIDFLSFFSDFLAEFLQNFELLSFKETMAGKFEGAIEAMVRPDNILKVKPIMEPFEGKKQSRTIALKDMTGNIRDETVIDFTKKVFYNDCIWDADQHRFRFQKICLSKENWKRIQEFNKDFDLGYYTHYFWRLHSLHHLLGIFSQLLQKTRGVRRKGLLKRLNHLPLQVIEVTVLFKDYSAFFVPREPFLIGSECWNEIKGMGSEFIVGFS